MCLFSRVTPPPCSAHFTCWKLMRNCTHSTAVPITRVMAKDNKLEKLWERLWENAIFPASPQLKHVGSFPGPAYRAEFTSQDTEKPFQRFFEKENNSENIINNNNNKSLWVCCCIPTAPVGENLISQAQTEESQSVQLLQKNILRKEKPLRCSFGGFPFPALSSCVGI